MLFKSTATNGHFRAGVYFSREGVDISRLDLSEYQIALIEADPDLTCDKSVKDETPKTEKLNADELDGWIRTAIPLIEDDDLGQDGRPKLVPLRAKIVELVEKAGLDQACVPAKISGKVRDAAWDALEIETAGASSGVRGAD